MREFAQMVMDDTAMRELAQTILEHTAAVWANGYALQQIELAAKKMAERWLAEHDDTPVTAEWLMQRGYYDTKESGRPDRYASDDRVCMGNGAFIPVVTVEFYPGKHDIAGKRLPVWRVRVYGHPRTFGTCPTRGYFVRLHEALGYPLKESL